PLGAECAGIAAICDRAHSKEGAMHFSGIRARTGSSLSPLTRFAPLFWFARGALAAGLVLTLGGQVRSHEPLSAPEPARVPAARTAAKAAIALIDLKYVFDHYDGFARAKAELEIDMQLSETMVALRKASVEKLQKDKQRHARGSEAYRQLDQLLTSEAAELTVQIESLKAELVRQQAELYHRAYRQIQEVVDAYVDEEGVLVVLRFNRTEVANSGDAKEVALLLNRPIVAYKKPADISDEVLR